MVTIHVETGPRMNSSNHAGWLKDQILLEKPINQESARKER